VLLRGEHSTLQSLQQEQHVAVQHATELRSTFPLVHKQSSRGDTVSSEEGLLVIIMHPPTLPQ
jgi:hypothetical protein